MQNKFSLSSILHLTESNLHVLSISYFYFDTEYIFLKLSPIYTWTMNNFLLVIIYTST